MKAHSQEFKDGIKEYGRQFKDSGSSSYDEGNNSYVIVILNQDKFNNVDYSIDATIFQSLMSSLKIELNTKLDDRCGSLSFETSLDGVSNTNGRYKYTGNIVKREENKERKSWIYHCNDNMIKAMVEYETPKFKSTDNNFVTGKTYYELVDGKYVVYTGSQTQSPYSLGLYEAITYPITVRDYIKAICTHCKISVSTNVLYLTFPNWDKMITSEHYVDSEGNSLGYTFRDVLDDLAECIGGFIRIKEYNNYQSPADYDSGLDIKYIQNTAPIVLYGNTSQETTSGKNLFDINEYLNAILRGGSSAVTLTKENDTTLKVLNKISQGNNYCAIPIPNTQYLLGKTLTASVKVTLNNVTNTKFVFYFLSDTTYTTQIGSTTKITSNGTYTLTTEIPSSLPSGSTRVALMIYGSDTGQPTNSYVLWENIQIEVGSSATSYEPYTNGASPNPDYPQEVEVVTGRNEIDIVGKNLLEITKSSYTSRGLTTTYDFDTGKLHTSGTTTQGWPWATEKTTISIPSGTTLTFSQQTKKSFVVAMRLYYNDSSYENCNISANTLSKTITTTHNIVAFAILLDRGGSVEVNEDFYLQLEIGSSATNFEVYKKQSYEINLGKNLLDKTNVILNKRISNLGQDYNENGYYISPFIKVEPNTTYTKNSPTADAYHRFAFYTTNDVSGFITISSSNSAATPSNCKYIRMCGLQTELDTTQVEKGNQATSYSPYFTPIELCKIDDYQDTIEYRYGSRNLFDDSVERKNAYVNAQEANIGQVATYSNSTATYTYVNCCYLEKNKTYTISWKQMSTQASSNTRQGVIVDENNIVLERLNTWGSGRTSITYTPQNSGYLIFCTDKNAGNIQIEQNSQATLYQPYGNGWFVKKNIGKIILNGSETWTKYLYTFYVNDLYEGKPLTICSHFTSVSSTQWSSSDETLRGKCSSLNTANQFKCMPLVDMTKTEFQTWLSNNNVTLYYSLSTPNYIKITGDLEKQLNELNKALPYDITNVGQVNNSKPFVLDTDKFLNEYIDEQYLKDKNINIGEKYGPINVLSLSRADDSDILVRPTGDLPENITELKITDNPILEQDNREDFIDNIFNAVNGLEYYLSDIASTGVLYYEIGDLYNIKIGDTFYKTMLLSNSFKRSTGLVEYMSAGEPKISVTDYTYAGSSDNVKKSSRNAWIKANKAEGIAEMVVEGIGQDGQVNAASVVASINNDGSSDVRLNADKITLEGYTTINNGFKVKTDGSVEISSGVLDLTDSGDLTSPRMKVSSETSEVEKESQYGSSGFYGKITKKDGTQVNSVYASTSTVKVEEDDITNNISNYSNLQYNGIYISKVNNSDNSQNETTMLGRNLIYLSRGTGSSYVRDFRLERNSNNTMQLELDGQADFNGETFIQGKLLNNLFNTVQLSSVNYNDYTTTGLFYFTSNCTNAPAQYVYCLVLGSGDTNDICVQVAFGMTTGYVWSRKYYNGSWSSWRQLDNM